MATQNQNTTSNTSGRPTQNDSQIGGRTAPKAPSTSTDRQGADSTRNTDIDSRRTISPSTSDDVSSKSADDMDLDDGGMEYNASEDEQTDAYAAPERKTSPDWDRTQDPKRNVYGQDKSGISSAPKGPQAEKFPGASEDPAGIEAQDSMEEDTQWNSTQQKDFNSDSKSDSRLNTTSNSSSPKKDNFQH